MNMIVASAGPSVYWYLTRATGTVALLLLSATVVLGVVDVRRWSTPAWPRFIVDSRTRAGRSRCCTDSAPEAT